MVIKDSRAAENKGRQPGFFIIIMGTVKRSKIIKISKLLIIASAIMSVPVLYAADISGSDSNSEARYYNYLEGKIRYGYSVDTFTKNNALLKQRIERLKKMRKTLQNAERATPESFEIIRTLNKEEEQNHYEHNQMIQTEKKMAKRSASAIGEFKYVPHSDGSIEYFKNGLVTRILNQRVVDELGNVKYKNTYNMKYNDQRLLVSYEADEKDELGNVTHIKWWGGKYAPGSVFYANKDTNAYKNLIEYHILETNASGDTKETYFKALEYQGKFTKKFYMSVKDSVYGNTEFTRSDITYINNDPEKVGSYHEEGVGVDGRTYHLDRYNIAYNDKNQITGYREKKTVYDYDGSFISTVITEAQFSYTSVPHLFGNDVQNPDPDRLEKSVIITTQNNIDGSRRTETLTTYYTYDSTLTLTNAYAEKEFSGQEADWYQYTDREGHTLAKAEDSEGNVTYLFLDPDTMKVVTVDPAEVTATLKEGNLFRGTSRIDFEILYGKPMDKQEVSRTYFYGRNFTEGELKRIEDTTVTYENGLVNNMRRLLTQSSETTTFYTVDLDGTHTGYRTIKTTYVYDDKAHLIDAYGEGTGKGYEYSDTRGWYWPYTSEISVDYDVILGRALQGEYNEVKDYENQDITKN